MTVPRDRGRPIASFSRRAPSARGRVPCARTRAALVAPSERLCCRVFSFTTLSHHSWPERKEKRLHRTLPGSPPSSSPRTPACSAKLSVTIMAAAGERLLTLTSSRLHSHSRTTSLSFCTSTFPPIPSSNSRPTSRRRAQSRSAPRTHCHLRGLRRRRALTRLSVPHAADYSRSALPTALP
ncbi:hypothetical protein K438DRAFT_1975843 [Mycena galopus ATCC 62051]|nr:hypothetical protein K438DRAFT_1975843 [Mycena galopus ATCC 62051]